MKIAARRKLLGQQVNQAGMDQAPLVVPFFRPGIGEINMRPGQRAIWNHVLQNFNRIVLDDANVVQFMFADLLEQTPHPRGMHLDPQVVILRMGGRDFRRSLTHAKTDFQNARGDTAKYLVKVNRSRTIGQNKMRSQFSERLLLAAAHASLTQDKASHSAVGETAGTLLSHEPIKPPGGEEGLAV